MFWYRHALAGIVRTELICLANRAEAIIRWNLRASAPKSGAIFGGLALRAKAIIVIGHS